MPAALVEVGFINTDQDNQIFDLKFPEMAQAIANGIMQTVQGADVTANEAVVYRIEMGMFRHKKNAETLKEKIEGITLEFVLKSGKDGKTFGSVSTKHIVEQLREKYDIRVDKRKFINAHPIGALGYSNLKVELYKGVIATIRVHLSEK